MLKEYPPLPYSLREMKFIRLLKKNCNVGREVVKLQREKKGIPDKAVIQEVRGYNDVMKMEIKHQFGQDIFEKLRAQAKQ